MVSKLEEPSCPFCRMKEFQGGRILEEREHLWVILSSPYLVPGHTLLVMKRHIPALMDLTPEEWLEVHAAGVSWVEKLKATYSRHLGRPVGCDFSQHDRQAFLPGSFISVPGHMHFHIRPRWLDDELQLECQHHETPMYKRQRHDVESIRALKELLGAS